MNQSIWRNLCPPVTLLMLQLSQLPLLAPNPLFLLWIKLHLIHLSLPTLRLMSPCPPILQLTRFPLNLPLTLLMPLSLRRRSTSKARPRPEAQGITEHILRTYKCKQYIHLHIVNILGHTQYTKYITLLSKLCFIRKPNDHAARQWQSFQ